MQKLIIDDKEIDLDIFGQEFQIIFDDEKTGLKKSIECQEITIKPQSRFIRTLWISYDITPTGQKINRRVFPQHITEPEDFDFFENVFGVPIKKYALNGLFRVFMSQFGLGSFAIYDQSLNMIPDQPVPFPEPEIDEEQNDD